MLAHLHALRIRCRWREHSALLTSVIDSCRRALDVQPAAARPRESNITPLGELAPRWRNFNFNLFPEGKVLDRLEGAVSL